jgi:hypothetical protein
LLIHLSHRANSLGAQVNLAAIASALRNDANDRDVRGDDVARLCCCAGFGDPNRNSDPTIGAAANALAAAGRAHTLTNPASTSAASPTTA